MPGYLCADLRRVDGLLFTMHNVVVDAVFDIRAGVWYVVEPFNIGLILGKEQGRVGHRSITSAGCSTPAWP